MIFIDPVTQQRIVYDRYSGDIQYPVRGGSSVSTQVIPKLGPSAIQQKNLGQSNAFWGTDPAVRGHTLPDKGVTGENKQTTDRHQIVRRMNVSEQ